MNLPKRYCAGFASLLLIGFLGAQYLNSVQNPKDPIRNPAQAGDRTYSLHGYTIPLHDLETVPPEEPAAIEATNQVFRQFFEKNYGTAAPKLPNESGLVLAGSRRGVHPKAHGCVAGTMKVSDNLDPQDQVGIFKTPSHQYNIIARFSNGSPHPERPDSASDSRGFGLKILGVEGSPLLKETPGADVGTQGFTMNSSDSFFSDTAVNYHRFMQIALLDTTDFGVAAKKFIVQLYASFQPLVATRVLRAFQKIQAVNATNPLALQYFSITAFQHGSGNQAPIVKYSLAPCDGTWVDPIDANDPNFLRINFKKYINEKPACFRFLVQHRTESSLSVEDPTMAWSQDVAPFKEVARIQLPAQPLMDEMVCEKEVINPWNTLPEHKPVGGINRLRLGAYLLSIEARKKTNHY